MTAVQVRAILESSGLQLTPETQKEISDRIGLLREMIDRVTGPHRRESEPATIFVVDNAR